MLQNNGDVLCKMLMSCCPAPLLHRRASNAAVRSSAEEMPASQTAGVGAVNSCRQVIPHTNGLSCVKVQACPEVPGSVIARRLDSSIQLLRTSPGPTVHSAVGVQGQDRLVPIDWSQAEVDTDGLA